MRVEDFEYSTKRRLPAQPDGRALLIRVAKTGGGTPGRAYEGAWFYRVTHVGLSHVLAEGDDLRTGTPKTHRQVVEILLDFLPGLLEEER